MRQSNIEITDTSGHLYRVFTQSQLPDAELPWTGLLGSIGFHVVLIPILAISFQHVARQFAPDDLVQVSSLNSRKVYMFRLPADLLKAKPDPPPPDPKPLPKKEAVKPPMPPPKAPELAATTPAPAPKVFKMPTESTPARPSPVIMQPPDFVTQVTKLPDIELPTITMVAPKPAKPRKVFDVGSLNKTRSMPKIPEPGLLPEPPSVTASNIPIRPLPTGVQAPKLPVYTAPPPLKAIESKSEEPPSAGGAVVQSPANLITTSPNPVPARETVEVPAVISLPKGGDGSSPSGTATPGISPGATSARLETATSATPGGKGTAPRPGPPASNPNGGKSAAETLPGLKDGQATVRIVHPTNGTHDISVVQSGVDHIPPFVRALIEGDPVYTVYLNVGWTREWILHFCIPRQGPPPPKQVGGFISLSSPPPLKPPFPLVTLVPQESVIGQLIPATELPLSTRPATALYGYLETSGKFSQLQAAGKLIPEVLEKVMPALKGWQMRPATQGGSPVRVQIILVMPKNELTAH